MESRRRGPDTDVHIVDTDLNDTACDRGSYPASRDRRARMVHFVMYDAGARHGVTGRRWRPSAALLAIGVITLSSLSCSERSRSVRAASELWWRAGQPDEPPQMLNASLPFEYPVAQYLRRVQGNVTLRLFVDTTGTVVRDSTRLERSSGIPAFDSAALVGAVRLRFRAARLRGVAIPVAMLFPVHFRHPEAPAVSSDTPYSAAPR
jgi:TonB family protein